MPLGQSPDAEYRMLSHVATEPHKVMVSVGGGLVRNVSGIPRGIAIEVHDFQVGGHHPMIHTTPNGQKALSWSLVE